MKMRILCIDDEPLALKLMVSMLEGRPDVGTLCRFSDASKALSCAKTTPFDIAFVDIMLGDANGLDFAQSLRSIQPQCKLIYCTGYPQYAIESITRGIVDGYLLKPVEDRQLQEILDRYCVRKPLTVSGSGMKLCISDRYGQPVIFARGKTMQLFSLLLERDGQGATTDELCERLWEHKADMIYKNRQYLYSLTNDLSNTLKEHDALEVFIRTAEGYALDVSQIEKE